MAWLAKELNPFSISPIIFCHMATGSLLLSVIGVLLNTRACDALPFFAIPHRCGVAVNRQVGVCGGTRLLAARKPCDTVPIEYQPRERARDHAHQPPQTVRANGIDICYEIFGNDNAEPLLLIMGLGAQMIHWDDEFCEQLAAHGFRVIRFDNRDIGKSSHLTGGKRLTPLELLKLRFLKIPVAATYKLIDMAKDTVGLMDALGIKSAHLVGASMGGMIAQEMTLSFPERVRSLTSIMSTTGNPRVPPPTREAAAMLMAPPPASKEEFIVRFGKTWKVLRAGSFPEEEALDPRSRRARLRSAASIRPASAGSSAPYSPPAAARSGCMA